MGPGAGAEGRGTGAGESAPDGPGPGPGAFYLMPAVSQAFLASPVQIWLAL